ncbi:hypothetical protein CLOP_g8958, partial [Closterium sp. NIES-67]
LQGRASQEGYAGVSHADKCGQRNVPLQHLGYSISRPDTLLAPDKKGFLTRVVHIESDPGTNEHADLADTIANARKGDGKKEQESVTQGNPGAADPTAGGVEAMVRGGGEAAGDGGGKCAVEGGKKSMGKGKKI